MQKTGRQPPAASQASLTPLAYSKGRLSESLPLPTVMTGWLDVASGETVVLQCGCKLKASKNKKGKGGSLYLTSRRLAFVYQSDRLPRADVWLRDITDQQIAKSESVFIMRVETKEASRVCLVFFRTMADRDAATKTLADLRGSATAAARPRQSAADECLILSGKARGAYLAANPDLYQLHQTMVVEGSLTDEEFWKEATLQNRLKVEHAEQSKGGGDLPRSYDLARSQDEEEIGLIDRAMTEHICASDPAVLAAYQRDVVQGSMSEDGFWRRYVAQKVHTRKKERRGGAPAAADTFGSGHGSLQPDELLHRLRTDTRAEREQHEHRVVSSERRTTEPVTEGDGAAALLSSTGNTTATINGTGDVRRGSRADNAFERLISNAEGAGASHELQHGSLPQSLGRGHSQSNQAGSA